MVALKVADEPSGENTRPQYGISEAFPAGSAVRPAPPGTIKRP